MPNQLLHDSKKHNLQLSPDDEHELIEKAKRTCHKTIMNALAMDNLPVDRVLSSIKTMRRAKLRKSQDLFEPHAEASCGYTQILISLNEAAHFFALDTQAKIQAYGKIYDQAVLKRDTIYPLIPRTSEHPLHYVGIERMLVDRGNAIHEMLLLECHDEFEYVNEKDGATRRGWVCSIHSIDLPQLSAHLPRDILFRSGHVFIETDSFGVMDYYCLSIPKLANMSKSKNQKLAQNYVSRIMQLEEFFYPERLNRYLIDGGKLLIDLPPKRAVAFCTLCDTKFTFFVLKKHCRLCGNIVCHECSVKWMSAMLQDKLAKIRVCVNCLSELGHTPLSDGVVHAHPLRQLPHAPVFKGRPKLKRAQSQIPMLRNDTKLTLSQEHSSISEPLWSSARPISSTNLSDSQRSLALFTQSSTQHEASTPSEAPSEDFTVMLEPSAEYDTMCCTLAITTQCQVATIGILDGNMLRLIGNHGIDDTKSDQVNGELSLAALESTRLYICPDLLPSASPPYKFYAALRLEYPSGRVAGLVELYDRNPRHGDVSGLVKQLQSVARVICKRLESPAQSTTESPMQKAPRRMRTSEIESADVFECTSPPNSLASSLIDVPEDGDDIPMLDRRSSAPTEVPAIRIHLLDDDELPDVKKDLRSPPPDHPNQSLDASTLREKLQSLEATANHQMQMSNKLHHQTKQIDSLVNQIQCMEAKLDDI
ncbi:hypothetical protein THRCLA_06514 [Thraustotheca clavata]|uniref:FYVE-type domain-containing protein n=1 Tax=Thraustotheca clavata TaxID=74557 RepID=A0A1V9ZNC8_9STRA|nr:hypothetical protein THRCLA_06514 [Thraustotheca clavata]